MKDKIILLFVAIIISFFLISLGFIFERDYYERYGGYWIFSFFLIIIVSWVSIEIIKQKHEKIYFLSLLILFLSEFFFIALIMILIHFFKIEWPEKGGAFYSIIFGIPLSMFLVYIFDLIDNIFYKSKRK